MALGIFALLVLAGFFAASRWMNHSNPTGTPYGVPARPLRVAVHAVSNNGSNQEALAAELREGEPDLVLLTGVSGRDLGPLASEWAARGFTPFQAYYPSQNLGEPDNPIGVAILSRYPLQDARPIPNPMNGAFGIWAACAVDGRRFYVACVHLSEGDKAAKIREGEFGNLRKAWEALGSPPLLVGGVTGNDVGGWPLSHLSVGNQGGVLLFSTGWKPDSKSGEPGEGASIVLRSVN